MVAVEAPARARAAPGGREFLAIVTLCMAMSAVSIDLLLPAFADMRADFDLAPGDTAVSRVITGYFLGLAVGQLFYGPLSDCFGRKPMLYVGMAVLLAGAVASTVQSSLFGFVVCRFVWGLGAAAPRSLAIAMVRDTSEGDRMARTMSLIMATFILVPIFAPAVGSVILALGPWRIVVWAQVAIAAGLTVWLTRLPETLHEGDRRSVSPRALAAAAGAVARSRQTVAFGVAVTALFGIMTSYIGTSEIVIDAVFGQADLFPVIFGVVACTLAAGSLLSARTVVRIGLARVVRLGAAYLVVTAAVLLVLVVASDGAPPLWAFLLALAVVLPAVTGLVPNCNTAAMAPLGHIAGMGAAVLGTVTTAGGALLGTLTDAAYDGTVTPFAVHVLVYGVVAALAILAVGRPRAQAVDVAVEAPHV